MIRFKASCSADEFTILIILCVIFLLRLLNPLWSISQYWTNLNPLCPEPSLLVSCKSCRLPSFVSQALFSKMSWLFLFFYPRNSMSGCLLVMLLSLFLSLRTSHLFCSSFITQADLSFPRGWCLILFGAKIYHLSFSDILSKNNLIFLGDSFVILHVSFPHRRTDLAFELEMLSLSSSLMLLRAETFFKALKTWLSFCILT